MLALLLQLYWYFVEKLGQGLSFHNRLQENLHLTGQHKRVWYTVLIAYGAQWLSDKVLDSRPKGRGFEPHRRHCVVVLEQDIFIPA